MQLVIVIFSLLGAGCATQAQIESKSLRKVASDTRTKADACFIELDKNPSVQIAYKNVVAKPVDDNYAANKYELTSSKQILNEELKNHFITYLIENDKCEKIFKDGAADFNLGIYRILLSTSEKLDLISQDLIDQKITIGEYNKQRIAIRTATRQNIMLTQEQMNNSLNNRHAAEIEKRDREWRESYNRMVEISLREREIEARKTIPLSPRTTTTNCYKIGNTLNCTSY